MVTATKTKVAVPATSRQLWALFCLTKNDHRAKGLTLEEASRLIDQAKTAKVQKLTGFAELYGRAHQAGLDAGRGATPTPMVVVQRANPLDDKSRIVKEYAPVMDGVCGFAWVKVRPATTAFARWLVKEDKGKVSGYEGGVILWADYPGQSYERKMAYARAFAEVLRGAGIKAHSNGRLD